MPLQNVVIAIDLGIQVAGALLTIALAIHMARGARWRDPLPGLRIIGGPELMHLAGVTAVYGILALALDYLLQWRLAGVSDAFEFGTRGWHARYAADSTAKLVASVFIVSALREHPTFAAHQSRLSWPRQLLVALAAMPVILVLCGVQYEALNWLWRLVWPEEAPAQHQVLQALRDDPMPPWGAAHLFVQAAVLAPIAEELFFRGLLLQTMLRYVPSASVAIAVSAVLFGLVHVSTPLQIIPLMTMGAILAWLRLRYRSLTLCIVVHMLFNLRTLLRVLLVPESLPPG